jgi:hypothetical protein
MSITSETIYETETHPDGSTLETRIGNKFKGDGYYNRADGLHTVQYVYTNFVGKIKIQATLAVDPEERDWFSLSETELVILLDPQSMTPQSTAKNFTGNYVWVRAVVEDWAQGIVNTILLNH